MLQEKTNKNVQTRTMYTSKNTIILHVHLSFIKKATHWKQ